MHLLGRKSPYDMNFLFIFWKVNNFLWDTALSANTNLHGSLILISLLYGVWTNSSKPWCSVLTKFPYNTNCLQYYLIIESRKSSLYGPKRNISQTLRGWLFTNWLIHFFVLWLHMSWDQIHWKYIRLTHQGIWTFLAPLYFSCKLKMNVQLPKLQLTRGYFYHAELF